MKTRKITSRNLLSRARFTSLLATVVAWCVGVFALNFTIVQAQNLYVSDSSSGNIYQFTPNGTQSTFASGLSAPQGLALDNEGNLYVADSGSGNIYKFTPAGVRSTFASGFLEYPTGLAFDSAGNLYVADSGGHNAIFEYTTNGTQSMFANGLQGPYGLVFDGTGNLFEADNASSSSQILKIMTNGTASAFASDVSYPVGVAFDSTGNLYVANNGGNKILKFTTNGIPSNFATGLNAPWGITFDSAGNLYEADHGSGIIYKFAPDGSRSTFASGLTSPDFIAIAPNSTLNLDIKMFAGIILKNGQIGSNYLIQATANLSSSNWATLTNVTLPSQPYIYIDYRSPTNSQQFYRAVPNWTNIPTGSAPTGLTYAVNPVVYTMGNVITPNLPSLSGGGPVTSWSISAGFSATGLTFNTATGVISGTPTASSTATGYTVSASNAGGATTATVTITVNN